MKQKQPSQIKLMGYILTLRKNGSYRNWRIICTFHQDGGMTVKNTALGWLFMVSKLHTIFCHLHHFRRNP